MASFGELTSKAKNRLLERAAKFEARIKRLFNNQEKTRSKLSTELTGSDAVIKHTADFLASFGSEVASLIQVSAKRLRNQDPVEVNKIKGRAIEELTAQTREQMKVNIEKYARGKLNIEQFREEAQSILRQQALAAAIIGVGGVGNLTENVLSAVRRQLTRQFELLDGFIADIEYRQITNKDRARAQQYANQAHTIALIAQRQGYFDALGGSEIEEKRVLGASDVHCEDCIGYAEEGWQDFGILPTPGQESVCGGACRCTMQQRIKDSSNSSQDTQDDEL